MVDLNSMQNAIENCHYAKKNGEPLGLETNFTYPLENFTDLVVLGEGMSLVAIETFGDVGRNI